MKRYYINGFREGKSYFYSLINGRITQEQKECLKSGKEITVNGNAFQIVFE